MILSIHFERSPLFRQEGTPSVIRNKQGWAKQVIFSLERPLARSPVRASEIEMSASELFIGAEDLSTPQLKFSISMCTHANAVGDQTSSPRKYQGSCSQWDGGFTTSDDQC
jgi:hypothetical protein